MKAKKSKQKKQNAIIREFRRERYDINYYIANVMSDGGWIIFIEDGAIKKEELKEFLTKKDQMRTAISAYVGANFDADKIANDIYQGVLSVVKDRLKTFEYEERDAEREMEERLLEEAEDAKFQAKKQAEDAKFQAKKQAILSDIDAIRKTLPKQQVSKFNSIIKALKETAI